jgi:hypothetical protein
MTIHPNRLNHPNPDRQARREEFARRVAQELWKPYQAELDSGCPYRQLAALMCVLEAIDNSVGSKMLDACTGEGLLRN